MEFYRYKHPKIDLCRQCDGKGYTEEFPEEDIFHQQEPQCNKCKLCEGSGRVVVSSETITTITAYIPDKTNNPINLTSYESKSNMEVQ